MSITVDDRGGLKFGRKWKDRFRLRGEKAKAHLTQWASLYFPQYGGIPEESFHLVSEVEVFRSSCGTESIFLDSAGRRIGSCYVRNL